MDDKSNRRKWRRQALDPPELGYLLTDDSGYKTGTTLHLIYEDGQRLALKQLLEDFNARARKIGVELKTAEFPEIWFEKP